MPIKKTLVSPTKSFPPNCDDPVLIGDSFNAESLIVAQCRRGQEKSEEKEKEEEEEEEPHQVFKVGCQY